MPTQKFVLADSLKTGIATMVGNREQFTGKTPLFPEHKKHDCVFMFFILATMRVLGKRHLHPLLCTVCFSFLYPPLVSVNQTVLLLRYCH